MARQDGRAPDALRDVHLSLGVAPAAAGSVLIEMGRTRVLCAASIEESVPRWMKEQGVPGGWITAEYSMLPYSTAPRKARDITRGKLDGRSSEIQRLVGRSLRAGVALDKLGPRTIWIDCDVLEADGGTRTASITGGCIALVLALRRLSEDGLLEENPLRRLVAAVSVGIVGGVPLLDLDYAEDRDAAVDLNLVMTDDMQFVELQGSGEEATFAAHELEAMIGLGSDGIARLVAGQRAAIEAADGARGSTPTPEPPPRP